MVLSLSLCVFSLSGYQVATGFITEPKADKDTTATPPSMCVLGMRMRIFCLAPGSQCVNTPTEAARARALLTAREARLPTNLHAWWKLDFLRMTELDIPKRD